MRFRGKIDIWFWMIFIVGEVFVCASLFLPEIPEIPILLVSLLLYNLLMLPFVLRNYVEVGEESVTVMFGLFKQTMRLSDLLEVYRIINPLSSTAASLDRIVLKGKRKRQGKYQ